jgi:hypothetical protein
VRWLIAFCSPAVVRALLAKALVVAPAIGAAATADGAFKNDSIAFFYVVNGRGIFAELLNVGAADTAHLDFDQAAVRRNVGHRIFSNFQLIRT